MTATETDGIPRQHGIVGASNVDLLVALTRVETMVSGMVANYQRADEHLTTEIARVEGDHLARINELRASIAAQAEQIAALRLVWAKAAGMAAVVASLVSVVVSRGWPLGG